MPFHMLLCREYIELPHFGVAKSQIILNFESINYHTYVYGARFSKIRISNYVWYHT